MKHFIMSFVVVAGLTMFAAGCCSTSKCDKANKECAKVEACKCVKCECKEKCVCQDCQCQAGACSKCPKVCPAPATAQ